MRAAAPVLDEAALRRIAAAYRPGLRCPRCAAFVCPGWEALPSAADDASLVRQGTLQSAGADSVAAADSAAAGSDYWSPDAPIALGVHPYDRCEVWSCQACGRPFLRYTEFGGYYEEHRIRELRAERITSPPA